jgi:hypothetical protein
MKKTIQPNFRRILTVSMLATALAGTMFVIVHAGGLATRPVSKISGDLVITDESGMKQAVVGAHVEYSQSTKDGTANVVIKRDGVKIAGASARIKADTQEEAAAAVSALILRLTNRNGRQGVQCSDNERFGLQCSDIKFEGDHRAFTEKADEMIVWWDAHAKLTYAAYVSPTPDLSGMGTLQLSGHGFRGTTPIYTFAILYLDPSDPTHVVGGRVEMSPSGPDCNITGGTLVRKTDTPAPDDFNLFATTDCLQLGLVANLAISVLADGTIDVRGISSDWPAGGGSQGTGETVVLEGVGNGKFVVPGP